MSENDPAPDNASVVAPPPLIYAGPLLAGLLLNRVRPAPILPPRVARVSGRLLTTSGIALALWFFRTMRRAGTPVDPREPVQRIVTTGPFRFSRNPAYTALTLIYVGISCQANARWPLLWLPAVLAAIQRGVIEREERYLVRTFGDEYEQYRSRVRRWL
jgi:protein-S-isoprenylcysteine O-methyltransferase Ste14